MTETEFKKEMAEFSKKKSDPQRLAIVAEVFEAIRSQMKEGCSYRYLIYDRLGFGPDAYVPLYEAGGMDISNMCFDVFDKANPNP